MKNLLNKSLVLALVTLILFVFSCKESSKPAMSGVFTFVKGSVLQNGQVAKLGGSVGENDIISSQKDSSAVIQFSSGALITLRSNSEVEVSKLAKGEAGQKTVTLTQRKGSTFNKIVSSENVDYSITSPTLTAGVRGTSFEVNVAESGDSEIKLLKGKVDVGSKESSKTLSLKKGNKIKVTKASGLSEPQALSKGDKKLLSSMNKIKIVADLESKMAQGGEFLKSEEVAPAEAISIALIEGVQEYTLDDLEKEFGKISKIRTKSGKIYVGNFVQRKNKINIRTTDGLFSIEPDELKSISSY
jgi:hypothetical protein